MTATIRTVFAVVVILIATLLMAPIQALAIVGWKSLSMKLPILWHRIFLRAIGTRVTVIGQLPNRKASEEPVMIVSNHLSWSDIMVLGSVTELCFIAKNEVKTWPGISWLARLQRTVFVNREQRRESKQQADTIASRMLSGDTMVLFAEGTTNDGHYVYPFKSALFGAAQYALKDAGLEKVTVQPVAIAYTRLFGMPLGRYHQSKAAWPGEVPLLPHLMGFLKNGAYDVEVIFGEPIAFTADSKRREIAKLTEDQVREMFAKAMQGHYLRQMK